MKENWVKIYQSTELIQVKLAEDVLKQHGIESHILNPSESAFPGISYIELYTLPEKAEEASQVLKDNGIE